MRTTKLEREKRRKRLRQLLAEGVTSPSLLADRLDVSRRTVYNDLDHIREDILSDEELETEEFVVEVLIRNRAVNRRLWDIVNREETLDNVRLGALKSIRKNTQDMARILGDLGIIEKQAEKIRVSLEEDYVHPLTIAFQEMRQKNEVEEKQSDEDTVLQASGEAW